LSGTLTALPRVCQGFSIIGAIMLDVNDIKKTIHFFDKNNCISNQIRKTYQSRYRILRKEQYTLPHHHRGSQIIGAKEFGDMSITDIMDILDKPFIELK
jgi:hypothetical protein